MTTTLAGTAGLVDLYLRLSNADETADSLERQERDLREWASREGLTVRKVWSDYGRSGFKKDVRRDGFNAAVKAVISGEVSTLAVWKLDRLSRRGAGHVGTILDDLEEAHGRLVFLKDGSRAFGEAMERKREKRRKERERRAAKRTTRLSPTNAPRAA